MFFYFRLDFIWNSHPWKLRSGDLGLSVSQPTLSRCCEYSRESQGLSVHAVSSLSVAVWVPRQLRSCLRRPLGSSFSATLEAVEVALLPVNHAEMRKSQGGSPQLHHLNPPPTSFLLGTLWPLPVSVWGLRTRVFHSQGCWSAPWPPLLSPGTANPLLSAPSPPFPSSSRVTGKLSGLRGIFTS